MSQAFESTLVEILSRTSAAGVALVDRELRYVTVNAALAAMNGLPADEHVGRHVRDVLWEPGIESIVGVLEHILSSGVPVVDASFSDNSNPQKPRHFLANYFPVREPDGSVSGLAAVVFEQTPAEQALRASESRLRRVSESGIVGMFLWTLDGGIYEANDAFLTMMGYTQADLANGLLNWRRMTPPEYAALDDRAVEELLTNGFHEQLVKEYIGEGGRRVPVTVTSAFLDGSREHGVCVCLDDRARRRAESEETRLLVAERERNQERERTLAAERAARAEAEAARADAEAANRAKSEFLAVMSHELRTPLNAIGGYAELIEQGIRGPVTAQQREDLQRIQKSQRHLLSLINEVLNYTRLESGAVSYDLAPVRVADALRAAEMLITPQLRAKGLRFSRVQCDGSLVVLADPEKLQQILLNLLSNAIKFTGVRDGWPGLVEVRCGTGHTERWVHLEVADTGRGIPPDKIDAVFEPFVQVDSGLVRPHGGTGLGLAISRDLARGMGGDLKLASVVGTGSVFTIALPRYVRGASALSPAAPRPIAEQEL
ncbi:MAG TPA: PAS domain-containing sensor histidine kinase [Gemmatimonas sp.]|nr:PAS domain-containing sensor histidine kinase [Gemmatimonas sp.]